MSDPLRAAADYAAGDDVFIRDVASGGEVSQLPPAMRGMWCWFFNSGTSPVFIRFKGGTSLGSTTVDESTASARNGTTGALTATAAGPHLVVPGGQIGQMRLQGAWTYLDQKGAGGGQLICGLAQGGFGAD